MNRMRTYTETNTIDTTRAFVHVADGIQCDRHGIKKLGRGALPICPSGIGLSGDGHSVTGERDGSNFIVSGIGDNVS